MPIDKEKVLGKKFSSRQEAEDFIVGRIELPASDRIRTLELIVADLLQRVEKLEK